MCLDKTPLERNHSSRTRIQKKLGIYWSKARLANAGVHDGRIRINGDWHHFSSTNIAVVSAVGLIIGTAIISNRSLVFRRCPSTVRSERVSEPRTFGSGEPHSANKVGGAATFW